MDIALDAPVSCRDGELGRVAHILVNPSLGRVTHIVVREPRSPHTLRLVPEKLLLEGGPERVRLSGDRKHFLALPEFIRQDYVPAGAYLALARKEHLRLPVAPSGWTFEHEAIPAGAVAVRGHEPVLAADGKVGKVDELLFDRHGGRVTHLILTEGHLWGKKRLLIPVELVERIEDGSIHLSIDRATVERLEEAGHPAA